MEQAGRSGPFHHMIRRKSALTYTGIDSERVREVMIKVLCAPLSGNGVFGDHLEEQFKRRKAQKEQLKDLLPEFSSKKPYIFTKRKSPSAETSHFNNAGSIAKKKRLDFDRSFESRPKHGNNVGRQAVRPETFPRKEPTSGNFRIPFKRQPRK